MNVYYNPEKFGLTIVKEIEDPNASYSFDMFILWRDGSGRLLWATDSGCSCPTPFEFLGVSDLSVLTDETWAAFDAAVTEWREWDDADGLVMLRHEMRMAAAKALAGAA